MVNYMYPYLPQVRSYFDVFESIIVSYKITAGTTTTTRIIIANFCYRYSYLQGELPT